MLSNDVGTFYKERLSELNRGHSGLAHALNLAFDQVLTCGNMLAAYLCPLMPGNHVRVRFHQKSGVFSDDDMIVDAMVRDVAPCSKFISNLGKSNLSELGWEVDFVFMKSNGYFNDSLVQTYRCANSLVSMSQVLNKDVSFEFLQSKPKQVVRSLLIGDDGHVYRYVEHPLQPGSGQMQRLLELDSLQQYWVYTDMLELEQMSCITETYEFV